MNRPRVALLLLAVLSLVSARSVAAEDFTPQIQIGTKTLLLNGIGVRKVTIFSIRAYVAELYLEHRSSDAQEILADTGVKKLVLVFIRDVSADRLYRGCADGIAENVENYQRFAAALDQLRQIIPEVVEGDRLEVIFDGDTARFIDQQGRDTTITAPGFGAALLAIWLGPDPADEGLKQGLLGIKP